MDSLGLFCGGYRVAFHSVDGLRDLCHDKERPLFKLLPPKLYVLRGRQSKGWWLPAATARSLATCPDRRVLMTSSGRARTSVCKNKAKRVRPSSNVANEMVSNVTFSLNTCVMCYRVITAPAYTSAGPMSLKQNGVSTFLITSGCTDLHTGHKPHW